MLNEQKIISITKTDLLDILFPNLLFLLMKLPEMETSKQEWLF